MKWISKRYLNGEATAVLGIAVVLRKNRIKCQRLPVNTRGAARQESFSHAQQGIDQHDDGNSHAGSMQDWPADPGHPVPETYEDVRGCSAPSNLSGSISDATRRAVSASLGTRAESCG